MLLSGLKTRDREWGGGVEGAVVSVVVRYFGLAHAGTGRTVVMGLILESTLDQQWEGSVAFDDVGEKKIRM